MIKNRPISIYCHLPWCIEKCPYCDFNSFKKNDRDDYEMYTKSICKDLINSKIHAEGRIVESIFFGGGTPSLFPERQIEKILQTISQHYTLSSQCEITLEMNPQSAETKKMQNYLNMGINRLSIGAQSFNNRLLKNIGRIHNQRQVEEAIDSAKILQFKSINIDIMYALPEQSKEEALEDLTKAIAYKPDHISWYELTIEANTYFAKHSPILPCQETQFIISEQGIALLEQSGYQRYEISAYCQPEKQCVHNKNYWNFGDYIGAGNGACSKVTKDKSIIRHQKYKNPGLYQQAPEKEILQQQIPREEILFEYMLNKLRLMTSFTIQEIMKKTLLEENIIKKELQPAIQQGFLELDQEKITLTQLGKRFLNDCQATFLHNQ